MRPLTWVLIKSDWCPFKERKLRHRETPAVPSYEEDIFKPRTELLEETNSPGMLILDF